MAAELKLYRGLARQLGALLDGERDCTANAANTSALIQLGVSDLNWVGFYFLRGDGLVLGPFQGGPACTRIPLGRGVCGTAAARSETVRVSDVHTFHGHIACDAASRAELVIPVLADGRLVGVLDLDSPVAGRFSEMDQQGLETLVRVFVEATDLSDWLA
jgi:GAF domain-containing protein